jgi:hypothetical protein
LIRSSSSSAPSSRAFGLPFEPPSTGAQISPHQLGRPIWLHSPCLSFITASLSAQLPPSGRQQLSAMLSMPSTPPSPPPPLTPTPLSSPPTNLAAFRPATHAHLPPSLHPSSTRAMLPPSLSSILPCHPSSRLQLSPLSLLPPRKATPLCWPCPTPRNLAP